MKVVFRVIPKSADLPKGAHGLCIRGERTIIINLMTGANPGLTFLHEVIHYYHPDWSETRVQKETAKRWRRMNTHSRFRLYHWLFCRKFRR